MKSRMKPDISSINLNPITLYNNTPKNRVKTNRQKKTLSAILLFTALNKRFNHITNVRSFFHTITIKES